MNFYETVYVVHPALQAGRLDDIMQNIEQLTTIHSLEVFLIKKLKNEQK